MSVIIAGCTLSGGIFGDASKGDLRAVKQMSIPRASPGPAYTQHPHTVPIPVAYNETLADFWSFAITGPYDTDPNWTSARLDPVPVILAEANGSPEYYEFYLRNGNSTVGTFWTSANRILGHTVFRIYPSAPSYNHSEIAREAMAVVRSRYANDTLVSATPGFYGGSYPLLCTIIEVNNASTGITERIVIDAFTHTIVPRTPSDGPPGQEYAWSIFDVIPERDWQSRIDQWILEDKNATPAVEYALQKGIDLRLPLSEKNASILREFYGIGRPDPRDGTRDVTPSQKNVPVSVHSIASNIIPFETASTSAITYLWRAQVDRPDISSWPSWRNVTLNMTPAFVVNDLDNRPYQYVFMVEREGKSAGTIVVPANAMLGAIAIETARGDYDIQNATIMAKDILERDYSGIPLRSERVIASAGSKPGQWVILEAGKNPSSETAMIAVNTQSNEIVSDNGSATEYRDRFLSPYTLISPEEMSAAVDRWKKNAAKDQEFLAYARSQGISPTRPLTDTEIMNLGMNLSRFYPGYIPLECRYDPLYNNTPYAPDEETRRWHERSFWYSTFYVDTSRDQAEIEKIAQKHIESGNYSLQVLAGGTAYVDYYVDIPESRYNRTVSLICENGGACIVEPADAMRVFVQGEKRVGGAIRVPVAIGRPREANIQRLISRGVSLHPMKAVTVHYNQTAFISKTDQERILASLNSDDRVLFALKEYPG